MSIRIRRASLDDRPAIEHFIRLAYEQLAPFKGPDRWFWQFVDNPFLDGMGELLPIWIALDDEDVVGQIAVQGTNVQVAGRRHAAGWCVDVMILPAYRGQGLGHRLHEAVARDVPILLMLTMAPATRRLAEHSGAITLGPTRQFSRWGRLRAEDVSRFLIRRTAHRRRLGWAVRRACDKLALHHVLALLTMPLVKVRDWRRLPAAPDITIIETSEVGEDLDKLWQRAGQGYSAICPRDSKFLEWRFMACPGLAYNIFLAYRDGNVVGYSVLRRASSQELRLGIIVDLFADRRDLPVFQSLVAHAVDYFGPDVASVECATSLPAIESVLRKAGFFVSRTLAPTVVVSDTGLRADIGRLNNEGFFSKADHDWDQINLA